jgi:hypothetical protein
MIFMGRKLKFTFEPEEHDSDGYVNGFIAFKNGERRLATDIEIELINIIKRSKLSVIHSEMFDNYL